MMMLRRVPLLFLLLVAGLRADAANPTPLDRAETAIRALREGDFSTAAATLRVAVEASPHDAAVQTAAATLLTLCGDVENASRAWSAALAMRPGDPLAQYGLAVVALARAQIDKARDYAGMAFGSGERGHCLLLDRYAQGLVAVGGAGDSLPLPEGLRAAAHALSAFAAARSGDHARTLAEVKAALGVLDGDPYAENSAVLLTGDRAAPLRFGGPPLQTGARLVPGLQESADRPYSGSITIGPDDVDPRTAYVAYRIDDTYRSIVNTPPYKIVWDSTRAPNGPHRVEIVVYDRSGIELSRASRQFRTYNVGAAAAESMADPRRERLREELWSLLAPRPSRLALAAMGAAAARALNNIPDETRLLELQTALDPAHGGAHARLASLRPLRAAPALWRGRDDAPWVALTFDDGPRPGITEQLLAVLTAEGVPATFFVIGRHVTAYPDLTRKIAEAGMQVENHTYTHTNLTILQPREVERELLRTNAAIRETTGRLPRYYRPPGGNTNAEVARLAEKWGLTACMWTVGGDTYEGGPPERLARFVIERTRPGAVILLHNGRMNTVVALPRIIAGLRAKGYQFVTVEQLDARRNGSLGAPVTDARNLPPNGRNALQR